MTEDFDESAYRERLLKYRPTNPLTAFGEAVRSLAARIADDYAIEEIETGALPFDKVLKITTPGIEMPAELRTEFEDIARRYLPIAYRCTFEFSRDQ